MSSDPSNINTEDEPVTAAAPGAATTAAATDEESPNAENVSPAEDEAKATKVTVATTETEEDSTTTTTATTPAATTPKPSILDHSFQAGDHVIRWEMLPIAWPIQIHGIVLNVSDAGVVLVDFGLTAQPQHAKEAETQQAQEQQQQESATDPDNTETNDESATTSSKEHADNNKKEPSLFSGDPKEMMDAQKKVNAKILNSFRKMNPTRGEKQRLTVVVLDDIAEINKWKKVNYDGSLFGFGGGTSEDDGAAADGTSEDGGGIKGSGKSNKWWKKMSFSSKKGANQADTTSNADADATEKEQDPSVVATESDAGSSTTSPRKSRLPSMTMGNGSNLNKWFRRSNDGPATPEAGGGSDDAALDVVSVTTDVSGDSVSNSTKTSWWNKLNGNRSRNNSLANEVAATKESSGEPNSATATSTETETDTGPQAPSKESPTNEQGGGIEESKEEPLDDDAEDNTTPSDGNPRATSPLAGRAMNPAMAKLLQSKSAEENDSKSPSAKKGGSSFTAKMNSMFKRNKQSMDEEAEASLPPKKLDLPKADPPKLVLARTRWLLQYGESVLPPYHAFHSNSECIAVYCKTGYWSTLQSDVFLHSTAIGNAKTMGAATLGVAASVPILAPVIAGLGIGMVAAPWLILHSSKQQADEHTQKMTDQFWAQAEPEVFVECIEHWSKLEEYYAALEKKSQSTTSEETAVASTTPTDTTDAEDSPKIIAL